MSVDPLTPVRLGQDLRRIGPHPDTAARTVDGTKVIVLVSGGVTYDITASAPARPA
ncbi:MAG TPA: hypothetical protein VFX25_24105 [Streptosporangiaceae bacterium]|nr:hypothetical protein [Streptosporangiaceae bacterium]